MNAHKWAEIAAKYGDAEAQARVGADLMGLKGLKWIANTDEGLQWLNRSAQHGCFDAFLFLYMNYHSGVNIPSRPHGYVPQDCVEALKWLNRLRDLQTHQNDEAGRNQSHQDAGIVRVTPVNRAVARRRGRGFRCRSRGSPARQSESGLTPMVVKFTKNGVRYHEPPYTKAEEDEFYRRQGPPIAVYRGAIMHGQPSKAPRLPTLSKEQLEKLGIPTGSVMIISPLPRRVSKTSVKRRSHQNQNDRA